MADRREYYKQYYLAHRDEKLQKYKNKHPVDVQSLQKEAYPSKEMLSNIMQYNPETGDIAWIKEVTGAIGDSGYPTVLLNGTFYLVHILVWIMIYGEYPLNYIDHINGNKHDNRMSNLRLVNKRENALNKQVHRDGKLPGATRDKTGYKVKAYLYNGYCAYLGHYKDGLYACGVYLKYLFTHGLISKSFIDSMNLDIDWDAITLPVTRIRFYQDRSRKLREYLGELSEEYLLGKARENA